ncbi:hypothetical protein [Actinoplanes sp. NPDC051851]|uniref:hypothetical protein n=1 Tax=Actinoplanes sp. NPDC051851 TaxID=3154753 RepID=UPI0034184AC6
MPRAVRALRVVDGVPVLTEVVPAMAGAHHRTGGPVQLPGGGLAIVRYVASADRTSGYDGQVVVQDAAGNAGTAVSMTGSGLTGMNVRRGMPMAGNSTTLFQWQLRNPGGSQPVLVTYRIATGAVRLLEPANSAESESTVQGMHATEDRIVEWPGRSGDACSAEILDTATGERVATLLPSIAGCDRVTMALSPDDRQVAMLVTGTAGDGWTQRVVVVDAATGVVRAEFPTPDLTAGTDPDRLVYGIAWQGAGRLVYARGLLGGAEPIVLSLRTGEKGSGS